MHNDFDRVQAALPKPVQLLHVDIYHIVINPHLFPASCCSGHGVCLLAPNLVPPSQTPPRLPTWSNHQEHWFWPPPKQTSIRRVRRPWNFHASIILTIIVLIRWNAPTGKLSLMIDRLSRPGFCHITPSSSLALPRSYHGLPNCPTYFLLYVSHRCLFVPECIQMTYSSH